jgi:iron complex outermembrane recepter protein
MTRKPRRSVSLMGAFRIRCLFGVAAIAAPFVPATAVAQNAPSSAQITLSIREQPMAEALAAFARQAGKQIVFYFDDAARLRAGPLNGTFTEQEALRRILGNSGLEYVYINQRTIGVGRRDAQGRFIFALRQPNAGDASTTVVVPTEPIIVTGSRIVRRDFQANSPIVTVEAETFESVSTFAIETVLNQLPQFVPALSQFETMDVQNSATSTPGASTLNLRGLGSNRNLVLIDGRRAQPVNGALLVDINSIPAAAVQRVEIITGGASAVYGADAVSGVVNFILKKNYDGLEVNAQYGITQRGDAEEFRVSALMGANLASGRGNVMFGAEHASRGAAYTRDRRFFRDGWADPASAFGRASRLSDVHWTPNPNSAWEDNRPTQAAVNAIFGEAGASRSGPFFFNADNTIYQDRGPGLDRYNGPFMVDEVCAEGLATRYVVSDCATGNIAYRYLDNSSVPVLRENQLGTMISTPLERYSGFGRFRFDLTESLTYFVQANFVDTQTRTRRVWSPAAAGWAVVIPHGDGVYAPSLNEDGSTNRDYQPGGIYGLDCPSTGGCTNSQTWPVPPELAALLAARPRPNEPFVLESPALRQIGDRGIDNNTTTYQFLTGLMGELPFRDWTWEAYSSHGRTRVVSSLTGTVSVENLRALATSPNYGRNASITGNTLINPAGFGGKIIRCTSGLHYFDVSKTVSEDCISAVEARMTHVTTLVQNVAEANAQGSVFELPAGEVRASIGVSYRENDFDYHVDKLEQAQNIADLPAGLFGSGSTQGRVTAREVYGELLVPLVAGLPLIRKFGLDLGYRYSDYNEVGGRSTYKILGDWEVTDFLRLRGGYNLAIRAPNVGELFQSDTTTVVVSAVGDPCLANTAAAYGNNPDNPDRQRVIDLCNILINDPFSEYSLDPLNYRANETPGGVVLGDITGNPNLDAEKARTWSIGAVIRSPLSSPLLSSFSAALDFYQIHVSGMIGTLSYDQTYRRCFDRQFNPNYDPQTEFCQRIRRDPGTGDSGSIGLVNVNRGTLETAGVDLQVNWFAHMSDLGLRRVPGRLGLTVLATYVDYYRVQAGQDGTISDFSGTGTSFRYRINTTLAYRNNTYDVSLRHRFLPGQPHPSSIANPSTTSIGPGDYHIFDLTGRWSITENIDLRFGIDNLFDRSPMITSRSASSSGSGNTNSGYYDVLGRRFYAGATARF